MPDPAAAWGWGLPLSKRCEGVLLTGFHSDLTLFLGPSKEEVKVHTLFMHVGSQILSSKIREASGGPGAWLLNLPDVDPTYFKMLIKYLYVGSAAGVTMGDALPLLKLATDFNVPDLKDRCAQILKGDLTTANALKMFQAAMEYGHDELTKSALDFICKNAATLLEQTEFSSLRLECLVEILQQDALQVKDELEVFDAAYKWAIEEAKRQGLDETDYNVLLKILTKPLLHVRFPLMDKEEYALKVAPKKVLSMDEHVAIMTYFLVSDQKRSTIPGGLFSSTPRVHLKWVQFVSLFGSVGSNTPLPTMKMMTQEMSKEGSFRITDSKYPLKLTTISFFEETFGNYYSPDCCYTHNINMEDLCVKVVISFDEDTRTTSYSYDGKLEPCTMMGRKGFSFGLKNDKGVAIANSRWYKISINFEGRTYCSGYQNTDCEHSNPNSLKWSCFEVFNDDVFIADDAGNASNAIMVECGKEEDSPFGIAQLRFDYR